ncbi:MAG: hypothetical protein E7013_00330 [Alphaproteobacteria bacterium]|nr:hypothetical protein [Alphaproteobacteria bacterium]
MSINLFKFTPSPEFSSKINNLLHVSNLKFKLQALFNSLLKSNSQADSAFVSQRFQFGRSMIEMIGVLAVIGVLSLVGLLAYSIAMNYYRANQTIHDVMLRGSNVPMMWETYNTANRPAEYSFVDLGNTNPVSYAVETKSEPVGQAFLYRVVVSDVPEAVCKRIISMQPTDIDLIMVGQNATYFENNHPNSNTQNATKNDCSETNKAMAFYFDEDGNGGGVPILQSQKNALKTAIVAH